MDDDIYIKTGSAGAEGVDYQLNLLLMTLLRAMDKYGDNFRLYSEWQKAGKFDDLVLIYKDGQDVHHHHLLQAKHVIDEKKTITCEDLISGDKFNIEKYFSSFKEIWENINGKIDDLILFSNLALNRNVLPFVDAIPSIPIFHFQQNKKDGKVPVMHKLNSKFIEEYQYSKLRRIAKAFLDYCFKNIGMKATNNVFRDCHVILSTDVVNVTEGKFRAEFIDGEDLSVGTRQFRDILMEELQVKDESFSSAETQAEWMGNIRMKFASGFGNSSSKKEPTNIWPITLLSPEDVELFKTFCNFFILASSQPNDVELTGHIRAEYKNPDSKLQVQQTTDFLQKKLRNWFKIVASKPLNSTFLKKNEKELKFINETERNIQALSPLQLEFETIPYEDQINTFLQQNKSPILHTNGNMKVSLMKLFHCLKKLEFPDYFFSPETELSKAIDLLEVFGESQTFNILIIKLQGNNKSKEVMEKLQHLIQTGKTKKKKIIVVTKKGKVLSLNTHLFMTVEDATHFEELKATSRQQLLDRRITFHGKEIAIKSILSNGIPMKHQDIQSWGCLMDETISINSQSDDIDLGYYINRTLHFECPYFDKNTIQQQLSDQHIVTYNLTDFNRAVMLEDEKPSRRHVHRLGEFIGNWYWRSSTSGYANLLFEKKGTTPFEINDNNDNFLEYVNESLIISDSAGYGKSTITFYLATKLMMENQHYWVTRLPASRCSFTAEEIQLTAASDNNKYNSFLMKKLFDVSTALECHIFEQYLKEEKSQSKLIFIFDGFDEINAESQNVIIEALKYLKKKPNVKFLGISTRPQHQQQLEEELQSRTWTLQPFTEDNKIAFLEKFWSSRAATEQNDKMRKYAKRLIALISRSISEKESQFTGIPLQMRMIGEIYEENAPKYVADGNIKEYFAIHPINLFGLYAQFIKKKEDVYLDDKMGFNQSAAQRSVTIKPFQKKQIEFALQIILVSGVDNSSEDIINNNNASESNSKLQLLEEDLEDCIGLGIIQKSQDGRFNFIHRTFAEFLTAKYLLDANVSVTEKLKKGQLMRVLEEKSFSVVRKFMDSKIDIEQMMVEFTKPENETVLCDIERHVFLDAIETLIFEESMKILNFLIELLISLIKRGRGLRSSIVRENKHNENIKRMNIKTDIDVLLETFKYLVSLVMNYPYHEGLAPCLIECQKRLEEGKIILNDEHLKSILWAFKKDDDKNYDWFHFHDETFFSFEYLRYLKCNKRDIFYFFLTELHVINDVMGVSNVLLSNLNESKSKLFQLMEGESANFIFDHFVYNFIKIIPYYVPDELETYFKFLSRYTILFDPWTWKRFQLFLEELSWNITNISQNINFFLKFAIEHRDLFSIDVIIQNLLIHKNLSLIENCALWGMTDALKLLLNVNDSELQSERRRILAFIRERHSDEQLMEIARVRSWWGIDSSINAFMDLCKFLFIAILTRDELNLEIFTSWITTEELFTSFVEHSIWDDDVIAFVDKSWPQYWMKCFITDKNFVDRAAGSKVICEILGNDQKINEEEFWEIMKLKNHRGNTILYTVFKLKEDSLNKWLELLKKRCSNSDNIEQLHKILKPILIKKEKFEFNVQEKLSEFSMEMIFKDIQNNLQNLILHFLCRNLQKLYSNIVINKKP